MAGARPGVFSTADFRIKESSSSGRVSLKAPLFLLQPGVLMDVTIYASLMVWFLQRFKQVTVADRLRWHAGCGVIREPALRARVSD
jgi:hypothetical protein